MEATFQDLYLCKMPEDTGRELRGMFLEYYKTTTRKTATQDYSAIIQWATDRGFSDKKIFRCRQAALVAWEGGNHDLKEARP